MESKKVLILIVEDEENVRSSMSELLMISGYYIIAAENGVLALEMFSDGIRPDLIISDILMPEMDGLRLHEELRQRGYIDFTPFLFLTAKTELDEIRHGMNMGADDYITKPVKYNDLIRAIEVRLEKKEAVTSHLSQKLRLTEDEETATRRAELTRLLGLISDSERRVLTELPSAKISKVTAERLFLSVKTVQNHRSHMVTKLGMSGQNSLLSFAIECKTLGLL